MVVLVIVSTLLSQRYVVVEFSETTIEQIPSAFKTLGEYKFSKYKEDYPLFYISEKEFTQEMETLIGVYSFGKMQ